MFSWPFVSGFMLTSTSFISNFSNRAVFFALLSLYPFQLLTALSTILLFVLFCADIFEMIMFSIRSPSIS